MYKFKEATEPVDLCLVLQKNTGKKKEKKKMVCELTTPTVYKKMKRKKKATEKGQKAHKQVTTLVS